MCYIKQLSLAAAVMIASSVGALLAAIAVAFLLDHTGHAMSWFSSTYLLFGLYAAPACCAILSTCMMAKKLFYKVYIKTTCILSRLYLVLIFAVLLSKLCNVSLCNYKVYLSSFFDSLDSGDLPYKIIKN